MAIMVFPKIPSVLQRRVVVTGLGMLTPLGMSVSQTWEGLLAGRCGIRELTEHDDQAFLSRAIRIAGKLPSEFDARKWEGQYQLADQLVNAYAASVSTEAIASSKWTPQTEEDERRAGMILGTEYGTLSAIIDSYSKLQTNGYESMDKSLLLKSTVNAFAGNLLAALRMRGPLHVVSASACSGHFAIGDAYRIIQRGEADVMLATSAEEGTQPPLLATFEKLGLLNRDDNGAPLTACRPFDKNRKGVVLSEGGCALVLEELEHAVKRHATIYAEVKSYATVVHPEFLTRPSEDGDGMQRVIDQALSAAGKAPEEVDLVVAQGSGTESGDFAESVALMRTFRLPGPLITATKGHLGDMVGAGSSVDAATAVLAIHLGEVPGILNLTTPLSLQGGRLNPNFLAKTCKHAVGTALTAAFGLGGVNSALVFSKVI